MSKSISCDVVIGNLMIEAIEKDHTEISFDKLFQFDERVNFELKEKYLTKFSINSVKRFESDYPFFVVETSNNCIRIVDYKANRAALLDRLKRYFRIGLPSVVVNEFISVSEEIFS